MSTRQFFLGSFVLIGLLRVLSADALADCVSGDCQNGTGKYSYGPSETYEEALIRSVYEVFNLDISDLPFHCLGKLSEEDGMDCFTEVYELTFNELPDFSATKFNDFFWEKPLDVITQLSKTGEGEKALSLCLKHFYFDCQNNLSC